MTPSPASEVIALASTVIAAATAWVGSKVIAVGTIDKDDLIGPVGALMLAVACLIALSGYYVWKEKKFYDREAARDKERAEQIALLARLAENSTRAIESSTVAIVEVQKSAENIDKMYAEQITVLRQVKSELERIKK